jgi:ABC-type glycerol-3-phosphate transport system substrate-binding protein
MRRLLLVLLLICSVLMFAEVVELRWTGWGGSEDDLKLAKAKIEAFQAKYPNIKIVPEVYPENYTQALLASLAAGNPPDVFLPKEACR